MDFISGFCPNWLQFATGCKFRAGFRHIRRVENGRDDAPAFCARWKLHLNPAEMYSQVKQFEIPFKLSNLNLSGQPIP